MNTARPRPLLIVISAPSGAGKSTLCDKLLAEFSNMGYSISCTTRAPRGGEINGRDYHFLTKKEFAARIEQGEFLEHAVVHAHQYGTLRQNVEEALAAGKDVLMDIDVQGAGQIRDAVAKAPSDSLLKRGFVDIFIAPPSMEALKERLVGRNEDSTDDIERRLANAAEEMACSDKYVYRVVNDELDRAYNDLLSIVKAEHEK